MNDAQKTKLIAIAHDSGMTIDGGEGGYIDCTFGQLFNFVERVLAEQLSNAEKPCKCHSLDENYTCVDCGTEWFEDQDGVIHRLTEPQNKICTSCNSPELCMEHGKACEHEHQSNTEHLRAAQRTAFDAWWEAKGCAIPATGTHLAEIAFAAGMHALASQPSGEPCAKLHITGTDTYPEITVQVLNGKYLQPSMSPVNVYVVPHPAPSGEPVALKTHGAWDGLETLDDLPDGTVLYTAPQPAPSVPDGWPHPADISRLRGKIVKNLGGDALATLDAMLAAAGEGSHE